VPYTNPTPADIKLDFPAFASVDDAVIQRHIDRSAIWVDETWFEGDYTWAKELVTADSLVQAGYGTGTDSEISSLGLSNVARLKSASFEVQFQSSTGAGSGSVPEQWSGSIYGRQFYALLRKNKAGPRVAVGGFGCIGPQSTDVPFAWKYGGFGI